MRLSNMRLTSKSLLELSKLDSLRNLEIAINIECFHDFRPIWLAPRAFDVERGLGSSKPFVNWVQSPLNTCFS